MAELTNKSTKSDLTNNIDIYYAMRSLYRYCKLIDLSAPNYLFEMELNLLRDRIINLSEQELNTLVSIWFEFRDQQIVKDELEDIEIDNELDKFFLTLN